MGYSSLLANDKLQSLLVGYFANFGGQLLPRPQIAIASLSIPVLEPFVDPVIPSLVALAIANYRVIIKKTRRIALTHWIQHPQEEIGAEL